MVRGPSWKQKKLAKHGPDEGKIQASKKSEKIIADPQVGH
jgi:hypothetical protein